jgi:thiol-disulfide isomerase/thioredoxin
MRSVLLYSLTLLSFFQGETVAQITPYERTPPVKHNPIGAYPKLHNAKSWDGREPGEYTLKFKINGIKPGDTVYLADYHLDGKYLRDTAVVDKKGMADFKGDKKLQRGMYLFVLPAKRGYFEFLVDDDQNFTITTDTAYYEGDYYTKMKILGSDQNQGFLEYQLGKSKIVEEIIQIDEQSKADTSKATREPLAKRRAELMEKKNNYDSDYIKAHPDHILSRFLYAMVDADFPSELPTLPDGTKDSMAPYRYYKTHYWDHVDLNEDALVRMPVNIIKQKLDLYFDKVLLPDADSCIQACSMLMKKCANSIEIEKYVIWYLTNRFETSNIMGLDRAFVYMAFETYCNGKAWWADSATIDKMCENAHRRKWTLQGEIAPALELQDDKGSWVNTGNVVAPYTILIFWDPTCGHCREVMPKLAKAYEENKGKGWKVMALYPSDKKKEWTDYMKEHPEVSGFTHLVRGEVRSQFYADQLYKYYVIASPTIFVLDEKKEILANRIDVEKLSDFINHMDKMKNAKGNGEF